MRRLIEDAEDEIDHLASDEADKAAALHDRAIYGQWKWLVLELVHH